MPTLAAGRLIQVFQYFEPFCQAPDRLTRQKEKVIE
jgi:hypothetical protein